MALGADTKVETSCFEDKESLPAGQASRLSAAYVRALRIGFIFVSIRISTLYVCAALSNRKKV